MGRNAGDNEGRISSLHSLGAAFGLLRLLAHQSVPSQCSPSMYRPSSPFDNRVRQVGPEVMLSPLL